jgi:hypothetical protein
MLLSARYPRYPRQSPSRTPPPRQQADDRRRDQDADRRQRGDRPSLAHKIPKIHVESAREQQEAQQAVHQRLVEVNPGYESFDGRLQRGSRDDVFERHHDQ